MWEQYPQPVGSQGIGPDLFEKILLEQEKIFSGSINFQTKCTDTYCERKNTPTDAQPEADE